MDGDRGRFDHQAALDRTWARISATLAGRREDLDCFVDEVLAAGGERDEPGAPIRVLVAADTEAARLVLADRLSGDHRFAVVGRASEPAQLLSEGVSALPDVVVLKLAVTDRVWLEAVGELTAWAPRTRLVAVSGLNARHLADMVTTTPVVRSLTSGRPPSARTPARTAPGPAPRPTAPPCVPPRPVAAPRSIIHEVMRQVGLPVGAPPR